MSLAFFLCLLSLFGLAAIGAPIAISMIVAAVVYLAMRGQDLGLAGEQIIQGLYDSFILLAVVDATVQVQLLVWIFAIRIMMVGASVGSYWANEAFAKGRWGDADKMDFETPLTTLVWLTSIVSVVLTFIVIKIVPEFEKIFYEFDIQLPVITALAIDVSDIAGLYLAVPLLVLGGCTVLAPFDRGAAPEAGAGDAATDHTGTEMASASPRASAASTRRTCGTRVRRSRRQSKKRSALATRRARGSRSHISRWTARAAGAQAQRRSS